ncbi:MAG: hypothetical protein ABSC77_00860 [Terracidiphilus sp.]|jgi:hypothetical protein
MNQNLYIKAVFAVIVILLLVIAYTYLRPNAPAKGVQGAHVPAQAQQSSQQIPQAAPQATTPTGGNTYAKAATATPTGGNTHAKAATATPTGGNTHAKADTTTPTKCSLGQIPAPNDLPELKGACMDKMKLIRYKYMEKINKKMGK